MTEYSTYDSEKHEWDEFEASVDLRSGDLEENQSVMGKYLEEVILSKQ